MAARLTKIPRGYTLVLLLLLAVLVPSACLLWFMNQAVQNERLAVRQKLVDAYRGNLALIPERLQTWLRETGAALEAELATNSPALIFSHAASRGTADAVICLDASGRILYPGAPSRENSSVIAETPEWVASEQLELAEPAAAAKSFSQVAATATNLNLMALALQAEARCLVKSGQTNAALSVLRHELLSTRLQNAADQRGNLIRLNAEFMTAELLAGNRGAISAGTAPHPKLLPEGERIPAALLAETLARLCQELNDYTETKIPSGQRAFLMREIHQTFTTNCAFPTLEAEELASRYFETAPVKPAEPTLQATAIGNVWQIGTPGRRLITLHRTSALVARLSGAVPQATIPRDVTLALLPPGEREQRLLASAEAGPALPNWRIAFVPTGRTFSDSAAEQRIASYVWISALVLATVLILAALIMRLIRRQMTLTQLRTDLVTNVTHELKTPLSSMRLLVDTLLDAPKLNEQTAREYLQLVAAENLRLSRLIDNFLTFSRIERNKYAFTFNPQEPRQLVDSATAAVQERFAAGTCAFDVQVAPDLPQVRADGDAVVTALINLLDNAWKYTGDEKQIRLRAFRENGTVAFAVSDNGHGLAPRETKRIFKRFYRVERRLSQSVSGCGLGLSIVQFIVDAHKGRVQVESTPGKGSTFTIYLPA